jgi:hypothetical protein
MKMKEPLCVGRNKVAEAMSRAYGFATVARLYKGEQELRIGDVVEKDGIPYFINTIFTHGVSVAPEGFDSVPQDANLEEFGLTLVK